MKLKALALDVPISLLGLGLLPPATANAYQNLYSYQGDDYSTDQNDNRQVAVCDEESDGHGVHSDYTVNGSGITQQIRDGDGAHNGCAFTGVYSQHIYKDRAVEEVPRAPDYFGGYVYPV